MVGLGHFLFSLAHAFNFFNHLQTNLFSRLKFQMYENVKTKLIKLKTISCYINTLNITPACIYFSIQSKMKNISKCHTQDERYSTYFSVRGFFQKKKPADYNGCFTSNINCQILYNIYEIMYICIYSVNHHINFDLA